MGERAIIHLNVADFAVAVERAVDPRLRGRPVVIAPLGAARAHVYDMSEEAYRAGVRKGMLLSRAAVACRDAMLVAPHPDRYERAMRAFLERALPYSPLIEWVDENGHLFLDVSGTGRLFGPPPDVAWRIRNETRAALGFDPIWAVAANKLVAKVATRLVKPAGEYIVEAGDEEEFLRPLPVALLPGVEADELRRLREFHLCRVADVAPLTLPQLEVALGAPGRARYLFESVRGVDPSPVRPVGQPRPLVVVDHEFGLPSAADSRPAPAAAAAAGRLLPPGGAEGDTHDAGVLEGALYRLTEHAGAELRQLRLAARRVGLVLDYSDGVRAARSATPETATANDFRLFALARSALERAWTRRVRVRHLRLVCDRLTFPPAQLELFPEDASRTRRENNLVAALDAIRAKYGVDAIRAGRTSYPRRTPTSPTSPTCPTGPTPRPASRLIMGRRPVMRTVDVDREAR